MNLWPGVGTVAYLAMSAHCAKSCADDKLSDTVCDAYQNFETVAAVAVATAVAVASAAILAPLGAAVMGIGAEGAGEAAVAVEFIAVEGVALAEGATAVGTHSVSLRNDSGKGTRGGGKGTHVSLPDIAGVWFRPMVGLSMALVSTSCRGQNRSCVMASRQKGKREKPGVKWWRGNACTEVACMYRHAKTAASAEKRDSRGRTEARAKSAGAGRQR